MIWLFLSCQPKKTLSDSPIETEITLSLESPSVIEERFKPNTTCDDGTQFQYISRYSKTYNRVDSLCIDEGYQENIQHVQPLNDAVCPIQYCGFSTSFKGYLVEAGLLKAVASYARIIEVKKDFNNVDFHEVIANRDINVQLSTSSAITKFLLNPETECLSKLESTSVNVTDPAIQYRYESKEYADYHSIATLFFEHKRTNDGYELLAVFDSTFTQQTTDTNFLETIKCISPDKIISLYEASYDFLIYPENHYLWGILAFPK